MKILVNRIVVEFNKIFAGTKRVGDSLLLEGKRMSELDVLNSSKLGYKIESQLSVNKSVLSEKTGLLQSFDSSGNAKVNSNGDPVYIKENLLSVYNSKLLNGVDSINLEVDIANRIRYNNGIINIPFSMSNLIKNINTFTVADSEKLGGKLESTLYVSRAVTADNATLLANTLPSKLVVEKARIATKLLSDDGTTELKESELRVYEATRLRNGANLYDLYQLRDWLVTQDQLKTVLTNASSSAYALTSNSGLKSFADIITFIKDDSTVEAYKSRRIITTDVTTPIKTGDEFKSWIIAHTELKDKVATLTAAVADRATRLGSTTESVNLVELDARIKATTVNTASNAVTVANQTPENIVDTVRQRILSQSTGANGLTQSEVTGFFDNSKVKLAIVAIKVDKAVQADTLTDGGSTITLANIYQKVKDNGGVYSSKYLLTDPNNAGGGTKSYSDIINSITTSQDTIISTASADYNTLAKIENNIKNSKTAIEASLSSEVSTRQSANTTLTNAINTEKTRIDAILSASSADKDSFAEIVTLINSVDTTNDTAFAGYVTSNNTALANEVTARTTAITTLTNTVSALDTAYKAADATLTTNLSDEVTARTNAVSALDTAYKAADATLTTNLSNEVTARTTAITTLTNTVSALDTAYKAADTTLTNNLSAEVTDRTNAITTLTNTVSALDTAYKAADTTLTTNLSNEVTARTDAITTLTGTVSALDTAYKAADTKIKTDLSNEVTARTNAITTLTNTVSALDTAYKAADTTLQSYITELDTAYKAADNTLTSSVNALTTAISDLDTAYKTADSNLSSNLTDEITARKAAITVLTTAISDLETTYKAADTTLTDAITTLSNTVSSLGTGGSTTTDTTLTDTVTTLSNNLTSEITARKAAISDLDTAYKAADTTLTDTVTTLSNNLTSEITARTNADIALQNNIDVEKTRIDGLLNSNGELIVKDVINAKNTTLTLKSTERVAITGAPFQFPTFDNTGRDALVVSNGDVIYNSELNKFQGYQNGVWINLDGTTN